MTEEDIIKRLADNMGIGVKREPEGVLVTLPCGHQERVLPRVGPISVPVKCSVDGERYRLLMRGTEVLNAVKGVSSKRR